MAKLQLIVVTPERTTLDEPVEGVSIPMFDGEQGILPGHSPLIGRLGPGELRTNIGGETKRFYVDGGFVQVVNDVVSVLTGRSIPVSEIDLAAAKEALVAAEAQAGNNSSLMEIKRKAVAQAKAQIRLVEGPGVN